METTDAKEKPVLSVHLEPEGKDLELERVKTVRQLFQVLGIQEETALVARDGKLLTPDRHLYSGQHILVRKVTSRG